jgi:hypothetical protein
MPGAKNMRTAANMPKASRRLSHQGERSRMANSELRGSWKATARF